jgi:hypothetical protein
VSSLPSATSRRHRRHQDTCAFSATRITHARGSASLRTFGQDAHALVNASATRSSLSTRLPTLTITIRRQSSQAAA